MLKIGITGGIGVGKSIVCSLFKQLGISVYDSDARAKELTLTNLQIISGIKRLFGDESYVNGELQRQYIASKVFADPTALGNLNELIHPVVASDFKSWCIERELECVKYIIIESAILIESGFSAHVDKIVCVTAPIELRISRVIKRDSLSRDGVENRINNQLSDQERCEVSQYNVVNDDKQLIIPQVIKLNSIFLHENL